ncbi:hypothetical protein EDD22DRAFT_851395 [Suillus occidentalis]|nr:hypothetical protein EDD22DRAFT_851395 [Suillus occidentalis]
MYPTKEYLGGDSFDTAADVAIQAAAPDESPACPARSRSFGILALIITYIGNMLRSQQRRRQEWRVMTVNVGKSHAPSEFGCAVYAKATWHSRDRVKVNEHIPSRNIYAGYFKLARLSSADNTNGAQLRRSLYALLSRTDDVDGHPAFDIDSLRKDLYKWLVVPESIFVQTLQSLRWATPLDSAIGNTVRQDASRRIEISIMVPKPAIVRQRRDTISKFEYMEVDGIVRILRVSLHEKLQPKHGQKSTTGALRTTESTGGSVSPIPRHLNRTSIKFSFELRFRTGHGHEGLLDMGNSSINGNEFGVWKRYSMFGVILKADLLEILKPTRDEPEPVHVMSPGHPFDGMNTMQNCQIRSIDTISHGFHGIPRDVSVALNDVECCWKGKLEHDWPNGHNS